MGWLNALPAELGLALLVLAVLAFIAMLAAVARLHPYIALVIGAVFTAVPIAQWMVFERRWFYSDGSAAGLFLFIIYAGMGIVCATIGAGFLASAVARIARGESDRSRLTGGQATLAMAGVAVVVGGAMFHRYQAARPWERPTWAARDERVIRLAPVSDAYALAWKRADEAPAMELVIPAADFAWNTGNGEHAVQETRDGPRVLRFVLRGGTDASLTLYRDDHLVDIEVLRAIERPQRARTSAPEGLWLERDGSGQKLLGLSCAEPTASVHAALADPGLAGRGIKCHAPDAPLARYVPALFGLENPRLHAVQVGQARYAICKTSFRYRARLATVQEQGPCFDAANLAALASAIELLDRLVKGGK